MEQSIRFREKEEPSPGSLLIRVAITGAILFIVAWMTGACIAPQANTAPDAPFPQEIPPLPFADNPDPTLCGLPQSDGRKGVITGEYNSEVVQPIVYLYNSHLRESIVGQVYPGTKVKITLRQSNPSLDYFFVETIDVDPPQKGWAPAPFVEIEQ